MKLKSLKKPAALLLAMALSVSALTGCSGGTESSSGSSSSSGDATSSTVSTEETSGSALPFEETLTVTMMISETATQQINEESSVVKYIQDNLNVDLQLQVIPSSDYSTRVATALASNSMPDIMRACQPAWFSQYATTGMLLNIDEYKDYAPDYFALVDAEDRVGETNKLRIDGSMYGFQTLEYYRVPIAPINCLRMDLLEEAGLDRLSHAETGCPAPGRPGFSFSPCFCPPV